jgi:uncharacterized membrane protein
MTKAVLVALLALFAVLGLVDSAYLAETAMTDGTLVCDIEGLDGCNQVAQSEYSRLYDIPLGIYGIGFYLLSLVLIALVAYNPRRLWFKLHLALSVLGALASLVFIGIQVFLIEATCIYCLASAAFTFIMLPLSYKLLRRFAPQLPAVIP